MLIIIDGHSKWIDTIPLRSATAKTTTDVLRRFFATFGLPKEQLVTMLPNSYHRIQDINTTILHGFKQNS